eukprot:5890332-Pyramimonas_sp.AAC.1
MQMVLGFNYNEAGVRGLLSMYPLEERAGRTLHDAKGCVAAHKKPKVKNTDLQSVVGTEPPRASSPDQTTPSPSSSSTPHPLNPL